jgi:hypothetical protein
MSLRKPGRHFARAARRDDLESSIQSAIIRELRAIGCTVSTTSQQRASRVTEGLPDLYVTHAAWGIACWVEMKRPGEEPSAVQREWHGDARAAGVPVLVATSAADAVRQVAALPRGSHG